MRDGLERRRSSSIDKTDARQPRLERGDAAWRSFLCHQPSSISSTSRQDFERSRHQEIKRRLPFSAEAPEELTAFHKRTMESCGSASACSCRAIQQARKLLAEKTAPEESRLAATSVILNRLPRGPAETTIPPRCISACLGEGSQPAPDPSRHLLVSYPLLVPAGEPYEGQRTLAFCPHLARRRRCRSRPVINARRLGPRPAVLVSSMMLRI